MTARLFDPTRLLAAQLYAMQSPLLWRGQEFPAVVMLADNILLPVVYTRAQAVALTLFAGHAGQFIVEKDERAFLGRRAVVEPITGDSLDARMRLLLLSDAMLETFKPVRGAPVEVEAIIEAYARAFQVIADDSAEAPQPLVSALPLAQ